MKTVERSEMWCSSFPVLLQSVCDWMCHVQNWCIWVRILRKYFHPCVTSIFLLNVQIIIRYITLLL